MTMEMMMITMATTTMEVVVATMLTIRGMMVMQAMMLVLVVRLPKAMPVPRLKMPLVLMCVIWERLLHPTNDVMGDDESSLLSTHSSNNMNTASR